MKKFGKVVMLGEPNVGKSSLVNALVGESVSVVTDVAGTTRQSAMGILTGDGWQIVFLDTPGMQKAKTVFDKSMNKSISSAVASADVICYVLDVNFNDKDIEKIANYQHKQPVIVVVNKMDKTSFERFYPQLAKLNELGFVRAFVPTSCKLGLNIDVLVSEIVKLLPDGKAQYEADEFTNQTTRKMAEDIIRATLINRLRSEVPHGVNVEIVRWKETSKETEIDADIICGKESHKPIIIGKNGKMLKEVGISARKEIEKLTEKHVRLNTRVLVREGWKDKTQVEN